jgi:hypothetical protein
MVSPPSAKIDLHESRTYDLAWIGTAPSAGEVPLSIRAILTFYEAPECLKQTIPST